ncbi:MAG: choice-of-anchor D domain-containing protein [Acidobacteriota bacterium]|nr:choice-of-anchor D domain-containing protein [Acidobacteriota bacterium]
MPTITVFLAESDRKRNRKRAKWAIPLLVGLTAAFAFGRQKSPIEAQSLPIVAPPPAVLMPPVVLTPMVELPAADETPVPVPVPTPAPALPAHAAVTPARMDFGDGPMNRGVAAQLATLRNDGGQPISRITTAIDGPFIATNGCGGGLAPGAECIVAVTFAPQQAGKFRGALTIVTGAERSRVLLRGSVTRPREVPPPPAPLPAPAPVVVPPPSPAVVPVPPAPKRVLCADPPRLHFARVGKQTITLTNSESTPLRVAGIAVVGKSGQSATGYEVDSGKCTRTLMPGQRCKFTVRATELAIQRGEIIELKVFHDDLTTGQRQLAMVSRCDRNRR